jgi:hypothetical protein
MATVKMREPRAPRVETPTEQIMKAAQQPGEVVDARGRHLSVRRPGALDKLRLFEAVGSQLAQNAPYLGMAMLAGCVTAIDGVPCQPMMTKRLIEARIAELGDEGTEAVAQYLYPDAEIGDDGEAEG